MNSVINDLAQAVRNHFYSTGTIRNTRITRPDAPILARRVIVEEFPKSTSETLKTANKAFYGGKENET